MALHISAKQFLVDVVEMSSSVISKFTSPGDLHDAKLKTSSRKPNLSEEPLWLKWREIQGASNWEGMIPDPEPASDEYDFSYEPTTMDEDLRSEIIKYGEFAQACYDGFNNDPYSCFRGDCLFPKDQLLQETIGYHHLVSRGYQVTKYLYATSHFDLPSFFAKPDDPFASWSNDSNWMGFIAVSTSEDEISRQGRREIVVSWRGTVTGLEWMENLQDFLRPTGLDPSDKDTVGVQVESGFLNIYTSNKPESRHNKKSAREQLLDEIQRLVELYRGEDLSITVTGHSLGGALALLSAYDIAELELNSGSSDRSTPATRATISTAAHIPVSVFSFSAPRVGNRMFAERCEVLNVKTLRVVNKNDIVPKVPGVIFNEQRHELSQVVESLLPWTYTHVGVEFALDMNDSPYLRPDADLKSQHNLEGLLHLVDGYQGPTQMFRSSGRRDLALVNKKSDLLLPQYGIPAFWKV